MTGRSQRHKVRRDGVASNGESFAEGAAPPGTQLPTLSGISPNTAVHGAANATITATGTLFTTLSKIVFAGADLATTFVSATSLTATAPIAARATSGVVKVLVRTGELQSGTQDFTFT